MYINELEDLEKKYIRTRANKDFFLGTKILKDIIIYLKNNNINGKYKSKLAEYKKELLENNKYSIDDFTTTEIPFEISDKIMEDFLKKFIDEKDFNKLMKKLGAQLFINNEDILKMEEDGGINMLSFCSLDFYDEKGNIIKGGADNNKHIYHNNYNLHLGVREGFISIILEKLFKEKQITIPKLMTFFQERIHIFPSSKTYYKFHKGLERYGEGDYLSSIHILIPTLEETIMYISSKLGIDTIKLEQDKNIYTGTKVFSSNFILSDDFQLKWSKNFSILLDNILFNPLGHKLRHKVAHGEIDFFECNFKSNSLILTLYIFIAVVTERQNNTYPDK